jgi:hypothetical protein
LGTISIWTAASTLFRKENIYPFRKLFLIAGGIILAVLISSIQLVPTAEYLLQSQRSNSVDFVKALAYSFWPWHFINFLMPNFFGSPASGDYWGYASYWEDAVYIGILPLVSAISTLIIFKKSLPSNHKKGIKFLLIFGWSATAIGFLLALGYNTNIFPFLFKYVPTFGMFNAPARIMVIPVFFLAWFSGIGISFWERPHGRQRIWLKRLMVMGLAILLGGFIAHSMISSINPTVFPPLFIFGISTIILFWLILRIPYPNENRNWEIWVYLFVLADLLIPTLTFNPYIDSSFYQRNKQDVPGYSGRVFVDQKNEYALKFKKYLRFTDFSAPGDWTRLRSALLPNINMLDAVYSASNFDPLLPGRFQTWLDQFDISSNPQRQTMLRDMDVKTLLLADIRGSDDGVYRIEEQRDGIAHWAGCFINATDSQNALDLTINNDNQGKVILEGGTDQHQNSTCIDKNSNIVITQQSPEKFALQIKTDSEGWIWISNSYYPGWEVTVDHRPSQIYQANYLFMGAHVPGGDHEIEFVYLSLSFYWGGVLSIIGGCILIMLKFIHH